MTKIVAFPVISDIMGLKWRYFLSVGKQPSPSLTWYCTEQRIAEWKADEHMLAFELRKDALKGEQWRVYCEILRENWVLMTFDCIISTLYQPH